MIIFVYFIIAASTIVFLLIKIIFGNQKGDRIDLPPFAISDIA
ncbi:TPA: hypothetical protein ACGFEM_000756 [Clostridioides difficile]|nr:hypothetical protein [Clostridioides difficile]EQI50404.1 putative membrane protein [Clostridioides difficile Y270]EQI68364.1 putative membrane protein [Clostridioides difficile Y343]EQJ91493.1 putative membrane protein [Clostridioides difficile P50]